MPFAIGHADTRIHYSVHSVHGGDGADDECVVLIQGLGLSSRFWFDVPERILARSRTPFRVVLIDNRGTGQSDRPGGLYRSEHMADDVVAVLDALDVRRAHLVGISMGGMIAQQVAIRHPERVAGLVLLATTAGFKAGQMPPFRSVLRLLLTALGNLAIARRAHYALLLPKKDQPRGDELMREWPALIEEEQLPLWTYIAQIAAALLHSPERHLHEVTCPTVIVAGEEDVVLPKRNSEILAGLLPNAHLEVLPEVGHAIPLTDDSVIPRALDRLAAATAS